MNLSYSAKVTSLGGFAASGWPVDALAGFQRHRRAFGGCYAALKPPQKHPRPPWNPSLERGPCCAWGEC